ncbi:MAG TPA: hypothetical protein VHM24_02200, partial [Gemmatimonadaceae bacterium]|nr:hypothetical protein [Gemmatimonadaceae bacterium]
LRGYLMLGRALADRGQEFAGAWNFGPRSEDGASVGELAARVGHAWGDIEITHRAEQNAPPEAGVLKIDSSKAQTLLGWRPVLSLDRAIELTVSGYRRFNSEDVPSSIEGILRSYWSDIVAAEN